MKTLDRICMYAFFILGIPLTIAVNINSANTVDTRDYAYEAYCDSIWDSDVDYYLDVLCTTDEYQEYIEEHGRWWED